MSVWVLAKLEDRVDGGRVHGDHCGETSQWEWKGIRGDCVKVFLEEFQRHGRSDEAFQLVE